MLLRGKRIGAYLLHFKSQLHETYFHLLTRFPWIALRNVCSSLKYQLLYLRNCVLLLRQDTLRNRNFSKSNFYEKKFNDLNEFIHFESESESVKISKMKKES